MVEVKLPRLVVPEVKLAKGWLLDVDLGPYGHLSVPSEDMVLVPEIVITEERVIFDTDEITDPLYMALNNERNAILRHVHDIRDQLDQNIKASSKAVSDYVNLIDSQAADKVSDLQKALGPVGSSIQDVLAPALRGVKIPGVEDQLSSVREGVETLVNEKLPSLGDLGKGFSTMMEKQLKDVNDVLHDVKDTMDKLSVPSITALAAPSEDLKPKTVSQALLEANSYAATASGVLTGTAVTGMAAEAAGLGQLESPIWAAMLIWSNLGVGRILQSRQTAYWDATIQPLLERYYRSKCLPSIPGPQDIIRMLVREVWTPEVTEKFGQFQEYPSLATEKFALHGFSEEWAKNYWAAHWELPATAEAFEMYHRKQISLEELKILLRAKDIMPFWRDKLINIAYRLIPRIDLRRGWEAGLISDEELPLRFEDLGYSPEDALTEAGLQKRFALTGEIGDLERMTKTRFKAGFITRDQAAAELDALHFSQERIQMRLSYYDLEASYEYSKELLDIIEDDYVKGKLTDEEFEHAVRQIVVRSEVVNIILMRAKQKRYKKAPTVLSIKLGD